jgi:tetratricopeptide (TPR) repeat protein
MHRSVLAVGVAVAESRGAGGSGGQFEVRLLGPVRVVYQGRLLELGGVQARSVLAVLMLSPGQVVPRGVIARNAWRGQPPATAGDLVAQYVSRLRSALAPAAAHLGLEAVRPGFRARIDPELIDARRFTGLVRRAGQDQAAHEDALAQAHLEQALALWRGSALALEDLEADWLRRQAAVLQDQRWEALERLAGLHHAAGQSARAVELLREEAPHHPQRDGLIALLVRALAATGASALAVEVADRAIDGLDQGGLPIGPHLRAARRDAQRPALAPGSPGAPRQLPPDTSALTGRARELAELLQLADSARSASAGTVMISAVDGMAGIGKTALAVHAGHLLAGRFPDGQLFVDLHGFTEGLRPRTAMEALADVLRTLGVSPQQIPQDLSARAALYRDRLARCRVLVVLDNARSEQQVRPLLPGHPGCLVLITSRRRLKALDEARVLSLDVLPPADAVALLYGTAGPGRILADDPILEEIARLCGCLPLALRIAAALLRHRPSWSLAHLADKLRDASPALAGFHDGDRDLAAVFDLSYTALPTDQQTLFRRLGLHPGPDTDPFATAALLDTDPDTADALLQHLVDHSLLAESPPGRYRMHDLVRAHAHALAATDPAPEREAALDRLLHYYAHTARTASLPLSRHPRTAPDTPAPAYAPALPGADAAREWLRAEYPNLDAAYTHAHAQARHDHVVALAAGLAEILRTDGRWANALTVHQSASETAQRRGRTAACADALTELGTVRRLTGDFTGSVDALSRAWKIHRRTGNQLGQANALTELGTVRRLTGDFTGSVDALTRALEIYHRADDHLGQANALTGLGTVRQLTGDYPGADDAYTRALETFRETDNRDGQAMALNELGTVRQWIGHYSAAEDAYARALEIFRETGNRNGQANALMNLGRVQSLTEDRSKADAALTQALEIYRETGNRTGEAYALTDQGIARRLAGNIPGALAALTRALAICRETGNHNGEAWALNHYAATLAANGERSRALAVYHQALTMNRELLKPDDEALSLEGIADHHLATGDPEQCLAHLNQALEIYRRLGMHPDTNRVQARVSEIGTARP